MTIDLLSEDDIPAALRLSTQAGWNQIEADWRRLLTLWPKTCFAARVDGQLVATSTLATYRDVLGWVGMVLVDETHRGRGIGGAILDAALDAAQIRHIQTVGLDATDLGRPVYLKRGFRDVIGIDRWVRGTVPPNSRGRKPRIPSAKNPGLPPSAIVAHQEVVSFDLRCTGIDRSALLRKLFSEPGVQCSTIPHAGRITAFAFMRTGRTSSHIGPVIAETEADAIAAIEQLLAARLENNHQQILIDVPRGQLTNRLTSTGFTLARKLTRMCLGAGTQFLVNPKIFAACSLELG